MIAKIQERSRRFKNDRKHSTRFKKDQEDSRRIKKIQEGSTRFKKDQKCSSRVNKIQEICSRFIIAKEDLRRVQSTRRRKKVLEIQEE